MANGFKRLGLIILVVISYFFLSFCGYWLLSNISPFSKEISFGIAFVIVLGFYIGAGFKFKKSKLF